MKRITVRQYMTKPATPEFDFMERWNHNNPMPLRTMVGTVEKETRGMVYMKLHGDIYAEQICSCMKCGRTLTNPVSQYFGIGPECGGHNYVNPFNTEEELKAAVSAYRAQLQQITWEGWIIKSAIVDDDTFSSSEDKEEVKEIVKPTVTMDIKPATKCNGKYSIYLTFAYNSAILTQIRALPFRYWDAEAKQWEVPADQLETLKTIFNGYEITIIGGNVLEEKQMVKNVDFAFKTQPYAHQIEGFEYGLQHDRWLLADEQGLGKTKQVIDIAVALKQIRGYKHCLIVCGVNGLKWNWLNEIKTHSNEGGYILGQRQRAGRLVVGSTNDKNDDLKRLETINDYFIITNVESLRNDDICTEITNRCKSGDIGLIAVDEIHKCKNPASQQGKALLKLKSEYRVAMTGTPVMNNPLDLYIILKWLGYEDHAFYSFKNHYCVFGGYGGYEIVGYKNMEELESKITNIMLRRKKEEVLDLPEKVHVAEYVDMTPKQAQIYKEVTADVLMNIDQIKMATNPLAELIRMRQATGYTGILSSTIQESAKLDRMEELVDEAVENGKKVVIFSNWTQMTTPIMERLCKKYYCVKVTGEYNTEAREAAVRHFQTNDDCKVIIGTIGAMGTGLTLTAGTVEIFMDEPWNRANKEQAEDRCHRVGTTESVTIYTLLCKGTIDERINDLVEQKGLMSDALIDGKLNISKSEVLDFLLS